MMWAKGYLDSSQMGGAFQMLRSNDLVWSRLLTTYLMGEREPMTDLMAWNADGTRMPYAMHSEYLRHLFLDNDLAEGRYRVGGRPVTLSGSGCRCSWSAPSRIMSRLGARCTSCTCSPARAALRADQRRHNAGIVSEPGHRHRHYSVATRPLDGAAPAPDDWLATAERHRRIVVAGMGRLAGRAFG
jgi:polyhydroxyalkanoate synthase